jgi:Ner family transcriptional regulator
MAKGLHREDIKAAIRKRGITPAQLSIRHNYDPSAVRVALYKPWPAVERLIADFLGLTPQRIWPDRYLSDGTPKSRHLPSSQRNTRRGRSNVRTAEAA